MKKILSVLCVVAMIASFACFSVSADETAPAASFAIVIDPVAEGATELTANLMVTLPEGATGYEIGAYGLDMSYDASVMTLAEEPSWEVKGTTVNSENVTDLPYMFLWVSVKTGEQYKAGTTLAATMKFTLAAPAAIGSEYKIDLAINEENGVASMASKDGTYVETKYTAEQVAVAGATYVVEAAPVITTTEAPETSEVTTTEAPKADDTTKADETTKAPETTTTKAPETTKAPDKATQTGDMAFVVVAVMVVALGAAVVVKKVSVR